MSDVLTFTFAADAVSGSLGKSYPRVSRGMESPTDGVLVHFSKREAAETARDLAMWSMECEMNGDDEAAACARETALKIIRAREDQHDTDR